MTRVRARTEGRVSEEETPSPASARTAGRDPPVHRVRHCQRLCHVQVIKDDRDGKECVSVTQYPLKLGLITLN